jgi:hypothetical protein
MGGSRSKQKGAQFERDVCRVFSLWVSKGQREDCFWRSAMSGGRATLKARKGLADKAQSQCGDLSSIHPLGELLLRIFLVECKFYKNFELQLVAFGKRGKMLPIWEKVKKEAKTFKRLPLLVAKQNAQPTLIGVNRLGYELLVLGIKNTVPVPTIIFPVLDLYMLNMQEVLSSISFSKIREAYKLDRIKEKK